MCREGGCGACIVAVTFTHPVTNEKTTLAVNSCLVSIFSCSDWNISTVEGMRNSDYSDIQKNIVESNGTQCGYCTSGMVMNMFALRKKLGDKLSKEDIENSFGGNLCRCTGYRPIISAFRKLAKADNEFEILDIEDLNKCSVKCQQSARGCNVNNPTQLCLESLKGEDCSHVYDTDSDVKWYKVFKISELKQIYKTYPLKQVRLVAGNTAQGVYRDMANGDVCVDVNSVSELKTHQLNNNELIIGGNVTLNEAKEIFTEAAKSNANFKYLEKFADHLDLVAHVPVRNIGTIAGNLMIKHTHNEFPSDVFLLLVSVQATLTIVDSNIFSHTVKMDDFLEHDMNKRVIKTISLPALDSTYKFETYKIMPRMQNSHAIINAAFFLKFKKDVIETATIAYGGVNPTFVHATNAEKYLVAKNPFDKKVLEQFFAILFKEINPDHVLPDPGPDFRRMLAVSLMYKFILSITPKVRDDYISGGKKLERFLSEASQDYQESPDMYPIGKSIHKLEAYAQVSGKAEYIMDMSDERDQHWAAFVLAKFPVGTQIKVDATEAKKITGVLDFIDYTDIKGVNSYVPFEEPDPIFCEGTVLYFNQPVGIVVAKSRNIAEKAAALVDVKVIKSSSVKPVLTPKDAMLEDARKKPIYKIEPKRIGKDAKKTITGQCNLHTQYHFHMETHCCNVVPKENNEYDMYSSTQCMDNSQAAASKCMNIAMNRINVIVRRLGGSYGAKISRNGLASCAAFIAAVKLQKPIKLWMTFEENMDAVGKRHRNHAEYEIKVDDDGVIQSLKLDAYLGIGLGNFWEVPKVEFPNTFMKCYTSDTFEINAYTVTTDNPSNAFCRAPGTTEAQAILEIIMEEIAYALNMDPLEVRLRNLKEEMKGMVQDTLTWAEFDKRKKEVDDFNKKNRWRKKGITIIPHSFTVDFLGTNYAMVTIFQSDGTVAVTHGGIEMGQGINTKVAQTVAYELGIDMNKVFVKPSNTVVAPNQFTTGASRTSESICMALIGCCKKLKEAIGMTSKSDDWLTLVQAAAAKNIKLCETSVFATDAEKSTNYEIHAACVTEVEYDVLTGNHIIKQVNLMEDMGYAMNPYVDVGQVEGAFVMGLGYWTSEDVILDPNTGELKNNRTWNYKIPGLKDIPEKFYLKFPHEPNPRSPFKTKSTAEPPLCLAFSVALALRQALKSAKLDAGFTLDKLWYPVEGPCTVEQNFNNSGLDTTQFKL